VANQDELLAHILDAAAARTKVTSRSTQTTRDLRTWVAKYIESAIGTSEYLLWTV